MMTASPKPKPAQGASSPPYALSSLSYRPPPQMALQARAERA
jgi:hypothetical protein